MGRKKSGQISRTRVLPADLPEDSVASQQPQPHLSWGARLCSGAAVFARCVVCRLRLLWQHLRRLTRRRPVSNLEDLVAAEKQRASTSSRHHHGQESRHQSIYHTFKPERLRRSVARPSEMIEQEPSHPVTPQVVVNGYCVPREVEEQYREYIRRSALTPVNSVLCHMCFFEMQRYENSTVPESKILWHCGTKHTLGVECKASKCKVRLPTSRDLQLHMHFCHADLP